ncbi:RIIa domain-containing protein 1 [Intoshia linei]|uniref:RIIa domain-containing protein 1 n=1 Tax=Intoshia linei TaxID=1819745 RepID=A0A177AV73_9BILA|nr:RIIa domain-containing protein 1 [Intoshia linei]
MHEFIEDVTKPDDKILSPEAMEKLKEKKIQTKIDNEKYLRSHLELKCMLNLFVKDILMNKPTNVCDFTADYFTNETLCLKVEEKLNKDLFH